MGYYTCRYCRESHNHRDTETVCQGPLGPIGLECTRKRGHTGLHAGCGVSKDMHPMAVWDDEGNFIYDHEDPKET